MPINWFLILTLNFRKPSGMSISQSWYIAYCEGRHSPAPNLTGADKKVRAPDWKDETEGKSPLLVYPVIFPSDTTRLRSTKKN